jgi:putative endonuclease
MEKEGFVYIMSNKNRTTLYIGVTNDLEVRVLQHKAGLSAFTKKYNLFDLIYFERILGMQDAIAREKQLKNWHKDWKWNLVKEYNPELLDLAADWFTKEEIEECRRSGKE